MRYIWNMGLSGSVLTIAYLCGKHLSRGRMNPKWRCWMLRGILFYYLFPLSFLKGVYEDVLRKYLLQSGQEEKIVFVDFNRSAVVYGDDMWLISKTFRWELVVGGLWIVAGVGAFLLVFAKYLREKKKLDWCSDADGMRVDEAVFEPIRQKNGIRRRIRYLDSTPADCEGRLAFTVGILHPVILYPAGRENRERELIMEHEMVHVRHGDLLCQMLASAACILHCVNPLVWYLRKELEQVAELYCDETVLQDRDAKTRQIYASLLLDMAEGGRRKGWIVALSAEGKKLRERMETAMKKRSYWGKAVSLSIVILAVLLNSLTVLAYRDVQVIQGDDDFLEMMASEPSGECEIVLLELLEESRYAVDVEILYDYQFVDKAGNIYPVSEGDEMAEVYASCNHHYKDGQIRKHNLNGNGGCTVTIYNGQACVLCGKVILGSRISVTNYDSCPH